MKKFLIASVVVAAMVVLGASKSSAQLATWDVAGSGTPFASTLVAGTSDGFLASAPALTRGGGLLGNSAANSFGSTNFNNTATFNDAVSFISFTVTPTAGYQLNLTDLKYSVNGSNTLPNQGQWGYSDGGGAFQLQGAFTVPFTGGALQTWNFADFSTQNSVEFRFWAWGSSAINSANPAAVGGSGRIFNTTGNDLVLDGTTSVAVPEPSTLSLIGFGILGMLAFSRRRFSRS